MRSTDHVDLSSLLTQTTVREIIAALTQGERTVSAVAAALELDIDTVSRYLVRLHRHGIVARRSKHRWHYYRLTRRVHLHQHDAGVAITIATPSSDQLSVSWLYQPTP